MLSAASLHAQDKLPPADPPYYRVSYEPSTVPGGPAFGVSYTVWIPPGVQALRGVIVRQHGCGTGASKEERTAAFDLHWQALARKHGCALLGPSYVLAEKESCSLWSDPRNGSEKTFQSKTYSDSPCAPLAEMRFTDTTATPGPVSACDALISARATVRFAEQRNRFLIETDREARTRHEKVHAARLKPPCIDVSDPLHDR